MIWNEFRLQAKQDLVSCLTLCQKNDYGNSAYLLQQGLEKYVKAFLFRFDLFVGPPHKLTHLPLGPMWEILLKNVNKKITSCNKDTRDLFEKSSLMLNLVGKFFAKVKDPNDNRWKYGMWKYSLGLTLDSSEKGVIDQLKNDMEKELLPIVSQAHELFSNNLNKILPMITSDQNKKKALEHIIEKIMDTSLDKLLNQSSSPRTDLTELVSEAPKIFERIGKLIKELTEMTDDKEILLQTDLMKLLLLAWFFTFREELVLTFPHEDMGRYPEIINGSSSRIIYKQNVIQLDKLISRVSTCCEKIDEMLDL